MPRIDRLNSARVLREVFARGARAVAPSVVAFALLDGEDRPARVGVTATRRIGNSVKRNRAKRRLREAARAEAANIKAGADLVLVASAATLDRSFDDLRADLRSALERLGAVTC